MALHLRVNANTMQRVYQEMERGGLITGKRGTGYFFTEDESMVAQINSSMASGAISKFLEEMRALGFSDNQILYQLKSKMTNGNNKTEGGEKDGTAASNGH
jgi:DNA-binding transcriptional regulator YhcF (GntR family)